MFGLLTLTPGFVSTAFSFFVVFSFSGLYFCLALLLSLSVFVSLYLLLKYSNTSMY